MLSVVVRYAVALVVLAIGDVVWLAWFGPVMVQPTLGGILREHVVWPAVIAFYLLFAVGIAVFAVTPALAQRSGARALLLGTLFGFLAYMTYDVTNYATLDAWTLKLGTIDVAWGSFISGVSAYASLVATCAVSGS